MSENNKQVATKPADRLRAMINTPGVQEQLKAALKDQAGAFAASLVELFISDRTLQQCEPGLVVAEAAKAASLRLPINKGLGFAWVLPYKKKGKFIPQFQMGYKGYIQLAMRTGLYKHINAGPVYEGELVGNDKLTGSIDLSGEKTSDTIVGYFGYFETVNGYSKAIYATVEDLTAHAKKYSKSYGSEYSPWKTSPESMYTKTIITRLLSKWGIMTVEIANQVTLDNDERNAMDYQENANQEYIDIPAGETIDVSTGEIEPPTVQQEDHPTPEEVARMEAEAEAENKNRNSEPQQAPFLQ